MKTALKKPIKAILHKPNGAEEDCKSKEEKFVLSRIREVNRICKKEGFTWESKEANKVASSLLSKEETHEKKRLLSIARILQKGAPEGKEASWWKIGILSNAWKLCVGNVPEEKKDRLYFLARKTRIESETWDPLFWDGRSVGHEVWPIGLAALKYVRAHIREDGKVISTKDCCNEVKKERQKNGDWDKPACMDCILSRHLLEAAGLLKKIDVAIEEETGGEIYGAGK